MASSFIQVGQGFSTNPDSSTAVREAVSAALKELVGSKPLISLVFYAGDYGAKKINESLSEMLKGTEFIGGSADAVFIGNKLLLHGIVVSSIASNGLSVSIASRDAVSQDPVGCAKQALKESLNGLEAQIKPGKGNSENRLLEKNSPYFCFLFSRGFKPNQLGDENVIFQSIRENLGNDVPVFGGSFGVPLETVFSKKPYEIYSLHSGKLMKDGLIVAIFQSKLSYHHSLEHCCRSTQHVGFVSKVEKQGFVVSEISNQSAVSWYCEKLEVSKKEFLEKQGYYTQLHPLGVPDDYGQFTIRAGGVPYKEEKLLFQQPINEGSAVFLMDASVENILKAPSWIQEDYEETKGKKVALNIGVLCASRRLTLQDKTESELVELNQKIPGPWIGFYGFTEIGSKPRKPAKLQHLSASVFSLFQEKK